LSKIYQKNTNAFYGVDKLNASQSSQGSLFQRNAANFYGEPAPAPGSRPYKIESQKSNTIADLKVKSVLHDRKMREDVSNLKN
jgi:hypothetical protein